jgi:hypothetical protein
MIVCGRWLREKNNWERYLVYRETEQDWDKELAEDVKGECASKYGPVINIKVIRESQVWMSFVLADPMTNCGPCYLGTHCLNGFFFQCRAKSMFSLILLSPPQKLMVD